MPAQFLAFQANYVVFRKRKWFLLYAFYPLEGSLVTNVYSGCLAYDYILLTHRKRILQGPPIRHRIAVLS